MVEKITVWKTINENTGKESHNHIENGWVEGEYPLPIEEKYTNQTAWQNEKWSKEHAYLVNGKITDKDGGFYVIQESAS